MQWLGTKMQRWSAMWFIIRSQKLQISLLLNWNITSKILKILPHQNRRIVKKYKGSFFNANSGYTCLVSQ